MSLLAASYEKVIKLVEKEKREAEEFFIEKRKIILQCNDKGNTSIPRIKLIQEESREREYFDAYVCKECTKKMIGATNAAKNKMLCYECMIRSRSPGILRFSIDCIGQEMYVLLGGIIANPP